MDVWQIVAQSVPFLNIVLHSFLHYLKQRDLAVKINVDMHHMEPNDEKENAGSRSEQLQKAIRFITSYLIPFGYLMFLIGFFTYGLWENSIQSAVKSN